MTSPGARLAQMLFWWVVAIFILPITAFVALALLQAKPHSQVQRVTSVQRWIEPLGEVVFTEHYLQKLVQTAPDFSRAQWRTVVLPDSVELDSSIALPANAAKARVWFRVTLAAALHGRQAPLGRLSIMGNRVMGAPWSVWTNEHLLQANLADWRIQWNTPLRVVLPETFNQQSGAGENALLIAIPYAKAQGYAMGSLFIGAADAIDLAWQDRNFWQADVPRTASLVALLLFFLNLQLAAGRRQEPVFAILCINALLLALSNLQYFYDFTGQDDLSKWFGSVMDASINWIVVFDMLFALEFLRIRATPLRIALLLYGAISTLATLPVWQWDENALMVQHYLNLSVYLAGYIMLTWHVVRNTTREGVIILLALAVQFAFGVHTLLNVTSQLHPDQIFTFPFGPIMTFVAFMYANNRRAIGAINTAERAQAELEAQLAQQQRQLQEQHAVMQQLEVKSRLASQRELMLQDLHDGLGSNLTSALLQARSGALQKDDTVLLLQDLAEELRNLSKAAPEDARNLNEVLADIRQRVRHRLLHGGIELEWDISLNLPAVCQQHPASGQHLRAMFSEAIANVIKHAQARRIRISAALHAGAGQQHEVRIEIADDGQGYDPARIERGRGLPGMRQRAAAIGARLEIASTLAQGTQWRLYLPC
ncbi:MAG: ATP-binding protein [Pseudomonadota bacterium]